MVSGGVRRRLCVCNVYRVVDTARARRGVTPNGTSYCASECNLRVVRRRAVRISSVVSYFVVGEKPSLGSFPILGMNLSRPGGRRFRAARWRPIIRPQSPETFGKFKSRFRPVQFGSSQRRPNLAIWLLGIESGTLQTFDYAFSVLKLVKEQGLMPRGCRTGPETWRHERLNLRDEETHR